MSIAEFILGITGLVLFIVLHTLLATWVCTRRPGGIVRNIGRN